MSNSGKCSVKMYTLSTQMKRLEAVIARLEDIADAFESSANTRSCAGPSRDLSAILGTVPSLIVEQSSNAGTSQAIAHSPEDLPTHIREFDVFLERSVGRYVALSNELGGAVATQASKVLASFQEQRKILVIALTTQKPDATKWKEMIQPMVDATAEVVEIQETTDHSDSMHNHLSCVADGIPVMAWIGIEMRAFNHVNKFLGYAQYFGNKVTKNYKDKNIKHVEWVQSYYQIFRDLTDLVKDQFPTGVQWLVVRKRTG